jgi:hypothetical protein
MNLRPLLTITALAGLPLLSGCMGLGRHGLHQRQQQGEDYPQLPNAPAALQVQPGQALALVLKGAGVQIYVCSKSREDDGKYQWLFKAPEAELTSSRGKVMGRHYAGPTWEAEDGSKVVAKVIASDKDTDPNAISWLLLSATSNSGSGIFAKTTGIQRLFTVSGKAPYEGCDREHVGKEARVSYSAQYYFYN